MSQSPNGAVSPEAPTPDDQRLVWVDMEMSGLDPERDHILEVAIVVTNAQLEICARGPVLVIHQSDAVLAAMDDWNQKTHGRSGLIDRVRASQVDELQAQAILLDFLRPWLAKGKSPMCGNTVHQDRRFMAKWMPDLEAWFHYRNLDVSTLKELCRRWRPALAKGFAKQGAHTALADIEESVAELRYYREHFLRLE